MVLKEGQVWKLRNMEEISISRVEFDTVNILFEGKSFRVPKCMAEDFIEIHKGEIVDEW